jgi:hypothetical protein
MLLVDRNDSYRDQDRLEPKDPILTLMYSGSRLPFTKSFSTLPIFYP